MSIKYNSLLWLSFGLTGAIPFAAVAQTSPTSEWTRVSGENGTFNIVGTRVVRFGAGSTWKTRSMTGPNQWCTNAFFGGDPAPGVVKSCQVQALPVASPTDTWTKVSSQNGSFNITGTRTVRFGAAPHWIQRQMTGPGQWCTVGFFGRDPAPGQAKACEVLTVAVTTPPVVTPPPVVTAPRGIGLPLYAGFHAGFSTAMLAPAPGEAPLSTDKSGRYNLDGTESPTGNFRTVCAPVAMDYNDPIVFPRQAGASHLHTFFGNVAVNENSTPVSLRASGNSACRGGTINRSSYWIPSMVDTRTNGAVMPRTANFYYKSGYQGVHPKDVKPFPPGMRIVAGDPRNTVSSPYGDIWHFECHNAGTGRGPSIPNCQVGDELVQVLTFPQCWDGVNVDSPDHQSHMAYAHHSRPNGCPESHPVALPEITFNIHYPITQANQSTHWRLSSDNPSAPAGYSTHGDWMNGWDETIMKFWVENCINKARDCGSHLLGKDSQMTGL